MIKPGMVNRAKLDFLKGLHQPNDKYMLALYSERADLNPDTVRYTGAEEVRGHGYTAGGIELNGYKGEIHGDCACITFDPATWNNSSIEARAGLIYNATRGNSAVVVVDFGATRKSSVGMFRVEFPQPSTDGAVIWIA